jgi:sortase A
VKRVERILMAVGLLLLGVYAAAWAHGRISSWLSLRAFEDATSALKKAENVAAAANSSAATESPASPSAQPPVPSSASAAAAVPTPDPGGLDFSLWSPRRIGAYRESLREAVGVPLAVLRIPKIGVVVPVLEGTDDFSLNRGVGHIEGTPRPGDPGNVGIAGHRDGFFRGLKDIAAGDRIEMVTPKGTEFFKVDRIAIVAPEEISVLDATPTPHLTLVTCYPFYFIGDAPQRYIVRAARIEPAGRL